MGVPFGDGKPGGAVSYTHLDVYKRQEFIKRLASASEVAVAPQLELEGMVMAITAEAKIGMPMDDLVAVSYTHLDVYKRQALYQTEPRLDTSGSIIQIWKNVNHKLSKFFKKFTILFFRILHSL